MSPVISLLSDIILLAALAATIFYCLRLSRQFNQMQANRKAFDALISSMNVASSRAEAAIHALKDTATGNVGALQDKINRAQSLADELEIMIQAGDSLADRLQSLAEKTSRAATAAADGDSPKVQDEGRHKEPFTQPRSRAEKELLEALKAKQPS